MNVLIQNDFGQLNSAYLQSVAVTCAVAVCDHEKVSDNLEISIAIVSNDEIRELNKTYRGINRSTDVLSFSMLDSTDSLEIINYINETSHTVILGDIIISNDKLIAQSHEYGQSITREFAFLVIHSLLHLFGYDHEEKVEDQIMRHKQREIFNKLIERGLNI